MTHDELQNNSSDTGTKVPMTHDELLENIDLTIKSDKRGTELYWAIRAVVELHRPVHNAYDTDYSWWGCLMCEEVYPCPTIQAIEKELS